MELFIVLLHLTGSIVTVIIINMAVALLAAHLVARNNDRLAIEIARALGVSVNELDSNKMKEKVNNVLCEKYSEVLFRNRLSDICGSIRDIYRWGCTTIEVVFICVLLWFIFTESSEYAVYSWAIVGITIFHWVTSYIFSKVCWLFTVSYPGEAKERRESAARGI